MAILELFVYSALLAILPNLVFALWYKSIFFNRKEAWSLEGWIILWNFCSGYYSKYMRDMLINEDKSKLHLPISGLYPFATNVSPNYEIVFVMQVVQGILFPICNTGVDGFFILAVFNGCAQLTILCKTIGQHVNKTRHVKPSEAHEPNKFNIYCPCLKCIVDNFVYLNE